MSECREGLACVDTGQGGRACMEACTAGVRLCDDGAVCLSSPADGLVCWFGGRTAVNRPCTEPLACETGTVCALGRCRQACELGNVAPCEGNEHCAPTGTGVLDGYCEVTPIAPDAGGTSEAGITP